MRNNSRIGCGLLLLLGLAGCADPPSAGPPVADVASMATLPASAATTAALQVTRWATYEDSGARFVLGLDPLDRARATLQVRAAEQDRIEITGISPAGKVLVSSQGEIVGEAGRLHDV